MLILLIYVYKNITNVLILGYTFNLKWCDNIPKY